MDGVTETSSCVSVSRPSEEPLTACWRASALALASAPGQNIALRSRSTVAGYPRPKRPNQLAGMQAKQPSSVRGLRRFIKSCGWELTRKGVDLVVSSYPRASEQPCQGTSKLRQIRQIVIRQQAGTEKYNNAPAGMSLRSWLLD